MVEKGGGELLRGRIHKSESAESLITQRRSIARTVRCGDSNSDAKSPELEKVVNGRWMENTQGPHATGRQKKREISQEKEGNLKMPSNNRLAGLASTSSRVRVFLIRNPEK